MKQRVKVNGILTCAATILIFSLPKLFFRPPLVDWLDDFSEVFGLALILFGFLWRIAARGHKAEHSPKGAGLVKSGPYSAVRNPMYLGIALIGLGVILILFNFWALTIFLLFFISRYILLIFREEKELIAHFKDDYRDYMKSTPRLLPKIKVVFTKDLKEILPLRISWIKKEIGSLLVSTVGVLIIESWEDVYSKGLGVYLGEFLVFALIAILFFRLVIYLNVNTDNKIIREA